MSLDISNVIQMHNTYNEVEKVFFLETLNNLGTLTPPRPILGLLVVRLLVSIGQIIGYFQDKWYKN